MKMLDSATSLSASLQPVDMRIPTMIQSDSILDAGHLLRSRVARVAATGFSPKAAPTASTSSAVAWPICLAVRFAVGWPSSVGLRAVLVAIRRPIVGRTLAAIGRAQVCRLIRLLLLLGRVIAASQSSMRSCQFLRL